jgi:hypothetical protein
MSTVFATLGSGVIGFVLGSLATFVLWMKTEDRDLKRGYIEIGGNCYQLQSMEDPLLKKYGGHGPLSSVNSSSE